MGERINSFFRKVNNIGAAIFGQQGFNPTPDSGGRRTPSFSSSPQFASRRGAEPFDATRPSFDPGVVVLSGAQQAWNATAFLILTGQMTIEDVPEYLRSVVQERVDNPAPSVLRAVAEDPDGSIAMSTAAEAAADAPASSEGIASLDPNQEAQRVADANAKRLEEEAAQRVADAERKRQKDLIDSDQADPPLRVGGDDSEINPITGRPWGEINLGGLTPEQMEEFGLGTSVRVPTEEEINKAIAENKNTTPEEKNVLEKAAKELLDKQNTKRLAEGKDPQVGSGGFWNNIGIITGVAGGIALLGNLFGGGSSPKKGGVSNLPGSTTPGSTTPSTGTPAPGSVTAKNPQEAYEIALEPGGWESLDPNSQAMASGHASTLPQGVVPGWLLALMGLSAVLGGSSDDPEPTSLQEAAERRSMEVYGNADLFDPEGPSPLQTLDPAFRDIKTFMPAGQVPDFNLNYRGVPGQMYANYEGTGPRGVAGLRGNINPIAQVAQGGLMGLANGGPASYPRMNGQIAGPGTETSDDIPAMLSDGEFVVNAKAVRGIGNLIGRKKPKSKAAQRREGARMMYALQQAGEKAARMT